MADELLKIGFEVDGGASLDGESGKRILSQLTKIANQISNNGDRLKIVVGLDTQETSKRLQSQLQRVVSKLKVSTSIQSDIKNDSSQKKSSNVKDTERKLTALQKQKIAESNLLTQEKIRAVTETNNAKIEQVRSRAKIENARLEQAEIKRTADKQKLAEMDLLSQEKIRAATEINNAKIQTAQSKTRLTNLRLEQAEMKKNAAKQKEASAANKIKSQIGSVDLDNKSVTEMFRGLKTQSNEAKVAVAEYEKVYNSLKNAYADSGSINSNNIEKATEAYKEYAEVLANTKKAIGADKNKDSADESVNKTAQAYKSLVLEVQKYGELNNRFRNNTRFSDEFDHISNALKNTDLSKNNVEVEKLKNNFKSLKIDINNANLEGQSFGAKFKEIFNQHGIWLSATTLLMSMVSVTKKLISNVIDLDSVITDLSVATGNNREQTKALLNTYSSLGKDLGATTVQVASSADAWLRQGKTLEETNKLIKDSLMLSKLGKMDDADATKALTSATKGYQMTVEETTSVVDKLTAVDTKSATDAGYLATAMAETSTSARIAGVDINRLIGYIALVGEVTQDGAESVGNFYKSLFARMGNIKSGNLIDPETAESLSDVETVLSGYGIKLRKNNQEFRNFGEVLDEVNSKWNTFGTVGQRAIAVAFSGVRQQEKFLTLMEGYKEALSYADVASNSLGTAEEKFNNAYLGSIEAKVNEFKASYEDLSNTIISDDSIKNVISSGSSILNILDNIMNTLGSIPTLAIAAAGALSTINNTGISIVNMPYHRLRFKSMVA